MPTKGIVILETSSVNISTFLKLLSQIQFQLLFFFCDMQWNATFL